MDDFCFYKVKNSRLSFLSAQVITALRQDCSRVPGADPIFFLNKALFKQEIGKHHENNWSLDV